MSQPGPWIEASPAGYATGRHHYTARIFRYLNWPGPGTEWFRCHHKHRNRKAAQDCAARMAQEANDV